MDNKKIAKTLKEAELYQKQGLLNEARNRYKAVLEAISLQDSQPESDKIITAVEKKIKDIDSEIKTVEKKVTSPYMSKESQDLITRMFLSSDAGDPKAAALEAAKALIKFGQFDRAEIDLRKLLSVDHLKLEAAKQIINCHILETKPEKAVKQFANWRAENLFSKEDLDKIKNQILEFLKSKGMEKDFAHRLEVRDAPVFKIAEPRSAPLDELEDAENMAGKKDTFFFEDDYEEFDVLASIKKTKKPDPKKK